MKWFATLLLMACLSLAGCQKSASRDETPRPRVVALSPALLRIMFDMGMGDHVVGVSEYSVLPEGVSLPVVGDYRNVRTEALMAVQPDVLLTQSEEKYFETIRKFQPDLKVEHFRIETLAEIAGAMERIGDIVRQPDLGRRQAEQFRTRLAAVKETTKNLPSRRVAFVMDYQNPFAAGGETYLDEMIQIAGGTNVLAGTRLWYKPPIETLLEARPDVIVCQCKPSQAEEATRYWKELFAKANPDLHVYTVTEDTWTIAAGHLADYTERLAKMIHPELGKR